MRKIASVLILVFAFTLTTQAQRKQRRMQKEKLTVEQATTLAVKIMALHLDLSNAQQKKIKPLIMAQMKNRRANFEKMKTWKEKRQKPSANERFKMANEKLDNQIAFQKEMKSILSSVQFEKFEKANAKRKQRANRKRTGMKKKMAWKKMKEQKE